MTLRDESNRYFVSSGPETSKKSIPLEPRLMVRPFSLTGIGRPSMIVADGQGESFSTHRKIIVFNETTRHRATFHGG